MHSMDAAPAADAFTAEQRTVPCIFSATALRTPVAARQDAEFPSSGYSLLRKNCLVMKYCRAVDGKGCSTGGNTADSAFIHLLISNTSSFPSRLHDPFLASLTPVAMF